MTIGGARYSRVTRSVRVELQLIALREIMPATAVALPRGEILAIVANMADIAFDATIAWIMRAQDDQLRTVAACGAYAETVAHTACALGTGAAGRATAGGQPVILQPGELDPTDAILGLLAQQAQPLVLLPLTSEGRILGLLGCVVPSEEVQHITFLMTLTQQACAAIDSDQLRSEARRCHQRLEGVFERRAEGVSVYDRDGMLALMDAAHELRTPLTTMRGNLDLLLCEPPLADAERRDVLTDLIAETERVSRLVDDLLTLASADAGRPLHPQRVPVAPLLDVLWRQAAVLAPDRILTCHSEPDLAVIGDPDALKQVLLILLDNALKFTPPGSTVIVTAAAQGPDVALGVQDSGPGIAPDLLPRIFERFAQGDETRAARGSGLGLAIAKALVEGQKGTLTVETRVGAGSLFTVTLPHAT